MSTELIEHSQHKLGIKLELWVVVFLPPPSMNCTCTYSHTEINNSTVIHFRKAQREFLGGCAGTADVVCDRCYDKSREKSNVKKHIRNGSV